ncbi:hypothetical protein [Phenylobacterium deserti]|uniref:Uncharacterized protein n=1 Tax=Phenylobacterium deserti TaxID=1914756 RepID=A0A328AC13_9CAUL|nr:hypothetical protein [Phenylobacterium deserti]RAK52017.1 hypothetical protein DJ018_12700 [Phenylobacterium deserti]
MSNLREAGLRPFHESGYEILDQDLVTRGEVVIWSVDPLIPRLGDLFLVESAGRTFEVEVVELATFKGGWSTTCRTANALT